MNRLEVSCEQQLTRDIGDALCEIERSSRLHTGLASELWLRHAVACLQGMLPAYEFLRSQGDEHLTRRCIEENFDLSVVEEFAWDRTAWWGGRVVRKAGVFEARYGQEWLAAVRPLQEYILSLPGYDAARIGRQLPKTKDHYQFIVQQLARLWCERQRGARISSLNSLPGVEAADRILMPGMGGKGGRKNEISDHC